MLIKPAYSPVKLLQPSSWQELVGAIYIQQRTQLLLNDYGRRLRCGVTLGVGGLAAELNYQAFSLSQPVLVSPQIKPGTVNGRLERLPIKSAVVDQVVMPFVLEFSRDPHQVLREVNRVLVDDGYLFISGFNPLSPAVLSGWLPRNRRRAPWSGRYFSAYRVKDWLSLLGYEIVEHNYFLGRFLAHDVDASQAQDDNVWTEKLCQKVPILHTGYAFLARKCVYMKTPKVKVSKAAALRGHPVAAARTQTSFTSNK